MREILMNVIEVNLIMIPLVLLLYLFGNKIRRKYGAKCLRILWILLAIRWVVPVNFSFHVLNLDIFWGTPIVTEAGGDVLTNDTPFITGEDDTSVHPGEVVHTGETVSTGENDTIRMGNKVLGSFNHFIHNPYQVMLFVWMLGCSICLIIMVVEYLRFVGSSYSNLQEVTDQSLLKEIQALEQQYLGHSKIQIFKKQDIISPMLIGCIRPKFILPDGITEAEEIELVIKHELCHYKNRDLWYKWLVIGAWIMNWFNPCVYLLKKELFASMELTCDNYALQYADEGIKEKYARLVLSYADNSKIVHMFGTSFYNGKRNMKKRIDNMLEDGHKNKYTGFLILSIMLILSAGLLISCGEKNQNEQQHMDNLQHQADEDRKQMENELQQMEDERQQAEDTRKQMEEEMQRLEDERQQAEDTRKQMEEELQRLEEEARTHMEEASTGLPTGFIEQPQVMYNNTIYYYYATGRDQDLPDGYSLVGTIGKVDSENTPDENYSAVGVDLFVGQEIYANSDISDILFLKYDTGFAEFATDYKVLE